MVLTDPGLVEAELVEADDELEVALDGQGGVLADGVEGGDEGAEGRGRSTMVVLSGGGGEPTRSQSRRSGCSRTMRS